MTANEMVRKVRQGTTAWRYSVVSIGYPGPVLHGKPVSEPINLGGGWVGFDFAKAFGYPVRLTPPCRLWAVTKAGVCSSLDSVLVSARR